MNLIEQAEVENLKKQYMYLTDLLKKHKTHEASYQRPQFHSSVPYGHSGLYSKIKTVRPANFNDFNTYKSKCHANLPTSRNTPNDSTSRNFAVRNYSHIPTSVLPKQNTSYSAKQAVPWKYNRASSSAQKLYNSSFKTVKTSDSAKVINPYSSEDTKFNSFGKPPVVSDSRTSKHFQSLEKNDPLPSKHAKGTKVSYLSCSDCIIEISEYENGELHISQKKAEFPVENNKLSNERTAGTSSDTDVSGSLLAEYEKCTTKAAKMLCVNNLPSREGHSVFSTPVIGSELRKVSLGSYPSVGHLEYANKAMESKAVKTDVELANTNLISEKEFLSSSCKSTESQTTSTRNAKYSKINVSTVRSTQNSTARQLLKNKYTVKKSNAIKCKPNEVKKCVPRPVKYTYVSKLSLPLASVKSQVNSGAKRTVLAPVKNVDKMKKLVPLPRKVQVTNSHFAASPYAPFSRKAKAVHLKNIYKVVNKSNPVTSRIVKNSPLRKVLCEKSLPKCGGHSSDKKWVTNITNGSRAVAHYSLSETVQQNSSDNHLTKSASKKMLCSSRVIPHKTASYKLQNMLNGSKIITCHSLRRVPQRKNLTKNKKPSISPSHKLFLDSHASIKKAKKVRLSKTTYKVVNKHVNHVSQVVQMIKTKYRTVNKRSASNSHLKWLQEQKKTYLRKKLQRSRNRTKVRWTYPHSSSAEHFKKHPILHPKTSRKQSLGQNKVLKKIRGVTYKVSKTKIKKSVSPKGVKRSGFISCNLKNSIIVNIHGNKFQLAPGGKSLKRLGTIEQQENKIPLSRIKIGGFTYVQLNENPGCLVRYSSQTQNLASRMLHRSIHTVRAAAAKKSTQKSNMYCMFFNRFGRCNKEGNCLYIHDPSKIAVCTRFLRGTCNKTDGCPFSHEVSPGKMAICCFFLQGNCTNNNCPYQHTSIKPGTRLCKAFVKGYCNSGRQCRDAHILACPQFICEGFCEKGSSCTWPHPPLKNIKKCCTIPEVKETKEKSAGVDDISDIRYFTYEPRLVSGQCVKRVESLGDDTQVNEVAPKIRNKKIKFHKQPEFIPLHVSDKEL